MLRDGFVYLDEALKGVYWDAKYSGYDNFMGRPAEGYKVNRVVLSQRAAMALICAHEKIKKDGLSFLVFDAYRPLRAVNDFCNWARDSSDAKRKSVHYPDISKHDLLTQGYIAPQSSHSRGSAIDLTLCLEDGTALDMGGIFDFMDPVSWHGCETISPSQKKNREKLRGVMLDSGFRDYSKEWWHYILRDEPFPNEYFDFEIE